jgi:hypothetical protein
MSNDYFKAQGWFKNYALNSQDSRGVFQQLVKEDEEAFRLASAETDKIKDMINEKFGPGTMKPASELPPIQNPFEDFEERNPAAEGGRMRFDDGLSAKKMPKIELDRINNPSQEALDEISSIIDKYTKTSNVAGKEIKHLSKDGPVDQIFKEIKTKGYKKPSISKELFKQVLKSKGITTYDNYRTNKIVFTLQDVLRKNNGDILSIKPSAVAEILPEFAIEGSKGGRGLPAFRTFLNYLEGSERLIDRSGLEKPGQIAGKPVSQIVDEMKQNFLEIKGGRARGNFTVFEETKLLEKLGLENPNVKANELKKLYEAEGGKSFKQRVNSLYLAKTGQVTQKTDGGKSIIDAVKSGEISNKLPDSLRNSFRTYARDYNFARMTRYAGEATNVDLINEYTKTANIFTKNNLEKMGVPKGLVAEHGLPISAYDRGVADESTRLKIDGFVTKEINDWKAKNFDYPVFRPGGLADKYKNASETDKPKIQAQIEEKLKLVKNRTPELVKNITFDFTDGKFTASSSTPVISNDVIPNLIKRGADVNEMFNAKQIDYIDGKGSFVGVNSGFNTDLLMKDPAVQKILNSKAGQAVKNAARGTAGTVGKVFGVADIVLGALDYENNISKGQKPKEALGNAVQAMSFNLYKSGDRARVEDVKERFVAKGGDAEIFDQATALNAKDQEINDLIFSNKKKADTFVRYAKEGRGTLTPDLEKSKADYEVLKKNLNEEIKNKIQERDNMVQSYKTNLRVSEAGAPIQIGGNEFFSQPFKDIKQSTMDKIAEENRKAYDMQKRQVNFTSGNIGNFLQNNIFTMNPQEKAELQRQINNMDERELYKFNLSRGMDPDNLIRFEDILRYKTNDPSLMGVNTTKYVNYDDRKAEGGIIGLRSKYEYKK